MAYADTGLVDSLMTLVVPSPLISTPDDSGTLSFSEEGFTAIHYACRFGGHDVLKSLLLRKDVDINSTDAKGKLNHVLPPAHVTLFTNVCMYAMPIYLDLSIIIIQDVRLYTLPPFSIK